MQWIETTLFFPSIRVTRPRFSDEYHKIQLYGDRWLPHNKMPSRCIIVAWKWTLPTQIEMGIASTSRKLNMASPSRTLKHKQLLSRKNHQTIVIQIIYFVKVRDYKQSILFWSKSQHTHTRPHKKEWPFRLDVTKLTYTQPKLVQTMQNNDETVNFQPGQKSKDFATPSNSEILQMNLALSGMKKQFSPV